MRSIAELKLALHKTGIVYYINQRYSSDNEYVLTLKHVLNQPLLFDICNQLGIQVERAGTSTYIIKTVEK